MSEMELQAENAALRLLLNATFESTRDRSSTLKAIDAVIVSAQVIAEEEGTTAFERLVVDALLGFRAQLVLPE